MHLSIESSLQLRDTAQSQKSFFHFTIMEYQTSLGQLTKNHGRGNFKPKAHQMMEESIEKQKILSVEIVRTHLQVHSI